MWNDIVRFSGSGRKVHMLLITGRPAPGLVEGIPVWGIHDVGEYAWTIPVDHIHVKTGTLRDWVCAPGWKATFAESSLKSDRHGAIGDEALKEIVLAGETLGNMRELGLLPSSPVQTKLEEELLEDIEKLQQAVWREIEGDV